MKARIFSYIIITALSSGATCMNDFEVELQDLDFSVHNLYKKYTVDDFIMRVKADKLDVNKADKHGFCLVHLAAREGKIDWLAALFMLGADLELRDESHTRWTPQAWALATNNPNVFRLLAHFRMTLDSAY
jgi:ankyrin repeat protein